MKTNIILNSIYRRIYIPLTRILVQVTIRYIVACSKCVALYTIQMSETFYLLESDVTHIFTNHTPLNPFSIRQNLRSVDGRF